jgi:hypothetical protein
VEREVVRQEVEFYRAYCMSKLAMNEGGDKAAAENALKEFASKYNNSYHFYQAAERPRECTPRPWRSSRRS